CLGGLGRAIVLFIEVRDQASPSRDRSGRRCSPPRRSASRWR
ncbi:MAG: hypothetical protein AVDCRST_MAG01-01-3073, partial [uncultured Rubrobacteraceae bacterium]